MSYQPRRSFFYNFRYAFNGIGYILRTQHNARFHLLATVAVCMAGVVAGLSLLEWACIFLAVGMVWITETVNTIVERIMDKISPDYDPATGRIKDMAAAAVLMASLMALGTGLFIFLPYILAAIE